MGFSWLINHDEKDDEQFEPVPAGVYLAEWDTTKADQPRKNKNNKEYLLIGFRIKNHPELAGRTVWERFYINDVTARIFKRLFRDYGVCRQSAGTERVDTDVLHGRLCRISVGQDTDETGRVWNRVQQIVPITSEAEAAQAQGAGQKKRFPF